MSYLAFWATFSTAGSSSSGFRAAIASSSGIWTRSAAASRARPSFSQWPTGM
jgi:hypothetical protein